MFLSLFQLNNLSNLIPSLIACELAVDSSSNWRLHVQLLEKFSCFPKCLSSDQIYYKFVPLFFRLLSSNVSLCSLLHVLNIEVRGRAKTKATAVAYHNQRNDTMDQWELKVNTRNPRQLRENALDQVVMVEQSTRVFKPITMKPTCDTQLKSASKYLLIQPFIIRFVVRTFVHVFVLSSASSFVHCKYRTLSFLHARQVQLPSPYVASKDTCLFFFLSFLFSVFYLSSLLQHIHYAFSSDTTEDLNKDKNCVVD